MTNVTMKLEQSQPQTDAAVHLFDNWFDPIKLACAIAFANSSMPWWRASSTWRCRGRAMLAVRRRRAVKRRARAVPVAP